MGWYSENVVNTIPNQACLNMRPVEIVQMIILCDKSYAAVWLIDDVYIRGLFANPEVNCTTPALCKIKIRVPLMMMTRPHSSKNINNNNDNNKSQCTCFLSVRTYYYAIFLTLFLFKNKSCTVGNWILTWNEKTMSKAMTKKINFL